MQKNLSGPLSYQPTFLLFLHLGCERRKWHFLILEKRRSSSFPVRIFHSSSSASAVEPRRVGRRKGTFSLSPIGGKFPPGPRERHVRENCDRERGGRGKTEKDGRGKRGTQFFLPPSPARSFLRSTKAGLTPKPSPTRKGGRGRTGKRRRKSFC